MRSTEVYRTAREILAPWCKSGGFKRAKTVMLGWHRPTDGDYLTFWLQVSQDGWNAYAGSRFTVEFELSEEPVVGTGRIHQRLFDLLTDCELRRATDLQNAVIAKLERPPPEYDVLHMGEAIAEWYLGKFEPVREPYTRRDDTWLRYADADDGRTWALFILDVLPGAIDRFVSHPRSAPRAPS